MATNVDKAEIAKFSELADKWWDLNGPFKPLHDMNATRLAVILEHITSATSKNVLDVGCGGGILTEALAKLDFTVTGIDMALNSLKAAEVHAKSQNLAIDYIQTTAEEFASKNPNKFQAVTCLEMLEHIPNPQLVVSACSDLCQVGGKLFFSTINRNPKSWLFAIVAAEYILKLLPKGTHHYNKLIKPSELARMAEKANLKVDKILGITYNPLTKNFKVANTDVAINYILIASK